MKAQRLIKRKQRSGMTQAQGGNAWKLEIMCYFSSLSWVYFQRNFKNRWSGPFIVSQIFSHGAMELINNQGEKFKVNGQRLYKYYGGKQDFYHLACLINTNT